MVHALVIELLNRSLLVAGNLTGFHAVAPMVIPEGIADVVFIHDRFTTDIFVLVYVGIVLVSTELAHRAVEQPGRAYFNRLARLYRQRRLVTQPETAVGPDVRPVA